MSDSWASVPRIKDNYIGSQEFESIDSTEKNSQSLQIKEIIAPKNPFIK